MTSSSPSSMQPEVKSVARQHAPLRRVLPKGTTEAASISVAQHRADHPLLFASASLQPIGHGIWSSASSAAVVGVHQRISLPIQPKHTSTQQHQPPSLASSATATGGGTASASSLADSCYSSCSDGEQQQQQQHLLLSRETSDCSSTCVCASGGGDVNRLAEELRQRAALWEDAGDSGDDDDDDNDGRRTVTERRPSAGAAASAPVDPQLLDFATRLGYTEHDLRTVLRRLGDGTGQAQQQQDLVLSELIKLDSSSSSSAAPKSTARAQRQQTTETGAAAGQHQTLGEAQAKQQQQRKSKQLRPIVVDGSNIAMNHGNNTVFSCGGIRECVQFFVHRGHTDILVFVPHFRREQPRHDSPIVDQHILLELEAERRLVWTPSRRMGGRRIVCHDDRYILKTASEKQAVVVSNDEYRDLLRENPRWRAVVDNLLLMYSFVDGKFMPPDDPLGRRGPKLDQFLTFAHTPLNAQLCPYAKKCTYGNKCKYFHPERVNGLWVSATDRLASRIAGDAGTENAKQLLASRPSLIAEHSQRQNVSSLLPRMARHTNVGRTRSLNCGGVGAIALAAAQMGGDGDQQWNQQQQKREEDDFVQKSWHHPLSPFPTSSATAGYHRHLPLLRFESSPVTGTTVLNTTTSTTGSSAVNNPLFVHGLAVATSQDHPYPHYHHSSLARFLSAPPPAGHHHYQMQTQSQHQQQLKPKQYMYAPSSAVWGNCEFSLSSGGFAQTFCTSPTVDSTFSLPPVGDNVTTSEQQRQHVQYHLCQLFPEATVLAVMGAHPKETNAQRLCQRIIAFQKGFADGEGNEEGEGAAEEGHRRSGPPPAQLPI